MKRNITIFFSLTILMSILITPVILGSSSDSEETNTENESIEDTDIEDSDTENESIEDTDVEDADAEDESIEDTDTEDESIEDIDDEDADTEDNNLEDESMEGTDEEDENTKELKTASDVNGLSSTQPWVITRTEEDIVNRIKAYTLAYEGNQVDIGNLNDIIIDEYSDSGAVNSITFKGSKRNVTFEGESIRTMLGLYSRNFELIKSDDTTYSNRSVINSSGKTENIDVSGAYVINGDRYNRELSGDLAVVRGADDQDIVPVIKISDDEYMFVGL